ncbi:MAG: hypothetical protein OEW58_10085 [Gammaproteobacteria bacterium]|nr:hypothetical protein [Gammaproteobacteria bacterium]
MNRINYKSLAFFTLLFSLISSAHAHKVNMFAFVEGNSVSIEAYFVDGKRAKNCEVTATDSTGKVLNQGQTNDQGQYQFSVSQPTDIRIAVNAGMGHMATYDIAASDFGDNSAGVAASDSDENGNALASADINSAELNAAIERAVAKSMAPVMRNISEMRAEKSLADIIGGIGFIFGLLGIYFYLKARKDTQSKA